MLFSFSFLSILRVTESESKPAQSKLNPPKARNKDEIKDKKKSTEIKPIQTKESGNQKSNETQKELVKDHVEKDSQDSTDLTSQSESKNTEGVSQSNKPKMKLDPNAAIFSPTPIKSKSEKKLDPNMKEFVPTEISQPANTKKVFIIIFLFFLSLLFLSLLLLLLGGLQIQIVFKLLLK